MKVSIIGAGNMGGAIACGLAASGQFGAGDIVCANPSKGKLEALHQQYSIIGTTTHNMVAALEADIIILAVKPWLAEKVLQEISDVFNPARQMLVSVVAGVPIAQLTEWTGHGEGEPTVFRSIPNTAACVGKSMTFLSAAHADARQMETVKALFDTIGSTMVVDEKMLETGDSRLVRHSVRVALHPRRSGRRRGIGMPCIPSYRDRRTKRSSAPGNCCCATACTPNRKSTG